MKDNTFENVIPSSMSDLNIIDNIYQFLYPFGLFCCHFHVSKPEKY